MNAQPTRRILVHAECSEDYYDAPDYILIEMIPEVIFDLKRRIQTAAEIKKTYSDFFKMTCWGSYVSFYAEPDDQSIRYKLEAVGLIETLDMHQPVVLPDNISFPDECEVILYMEQVVVYADGDLIFKSFDWHSDVEIRTPTLESEFLFGEEFGMKAAILKLSDLQSQKRWDPGFLIPWSEHRDQVEILLNKYSYAQLLDLAKRLPFYDPGLCVKRGNSPRGNGYSALDHMNASELAVYICMAYRYYDAVLEDRAKGVEIEAQQKAARLRENVDRYEIYFPRGKMKERIMPDYHVSGHCDQCDVNKKLGEYDSPEQAEGVANRMLPIWPLEHKETTGHTEGYIDYSYLYSDVNRLYPKRQEKE